MSGAINGGGMVVSLAAEDDFDGWRAGVRRAVAHGIPATAVAWRVGNAPLDLLDRLIASHGTGGDGTGDDRAGGAGKEGSAPAMPPVPAEFLRLARSVVCHRDPERFRLLHRAVESLTARRGWWGDHADPLRDRLSRMAEDVGRDVHKMRAFVRFREVRLPDADTPRFVAWFEPAHYILRRNARFFVERFTAMHWSILTPDGALHWDGARLDEGPPATRGDAPVGDPVEDAWRRYYAAIFNPARVKVRAMMREMPRKYWADMPETALIPGLLAEAQGRVASMLDAAAAPDTATPK